LNMDLYNQPKRSGISRSSFVTVLLLVLGLTGYALYNVVVKPNQKDTANVTDVKSSTAIDSLAGIQIKPKKKITRPKRKTAVPDTNKEPSPVGSTKNAEVSTGNKNEISTGHKYRIKNRAFFYANPDRLSITAYYVADHNAILTSLQEQPGFVYVKFSNRNGKVTETWLAKNDLDLVE